MSLTAVACYVPPTPAPVTHYENLFNSLASMCVDELSHGPVVIGADLNLHLGSVAMNQHAHSCGRRKVWETVWQDICRTRKVRLTILSDTSVHSFFSSSSKKGSVLDAIFLLTKEDERCTAYIGKTIPTHIDHSIVSGTFSSPKIKIQGGRAEYDERIKWEGIRYDKEAKKAFGSILNRIIMEKNGAKALDAESFVSLVRDISEKELGVTKVPKPIPSAKVISHTGQGKKRRKAQLWWSKALEDVSTEIKASRRKISSLNNKLTRWQRREGPRDQLQQRLMVERQTLQRQILRFQRSERREKKEYYEAMAKSMTPGDPVHITTAHKIRKKVLEVASGKGKGIIYDADTMNEAWGKIFRGAQTELPNQAFLDSTLEEIKSEAQNEEEITLTVDHVLAGIKGLKLRKAPGLDGVANEALRLIDDKEALQVIANIFTEMVNDPTKLPHEWKRGLVALIPKKDNPTPLDYRPIALLPHMAKFMELTVMAYLRKDLKSERLLGAYQGGFRIGRGTEESSLSLLAMDEICIHRQKPLISLFLDIKKAYDSVPAPVLAASLKRKGIPNRLTHFLYEWVSGHERKLLISENDTDEAWLKVAVGVPQGSVLAPFLFACVMDTLHAFLEGEKVLGVDPRTQTPVVEVLSNGPQSWRAIMYADDTTGFSHHISQAQTFLNRVGYWSDISGMKFHPDKFEILRSGYVAQKSWKHAPKSPLERQKFVRLSSLKYQRKPVPEPVEKAKHLGLYKKASGAKGSSSLMGNISKRMRAADKSSEAAAFAYPAGPNTASVLFVSNIHRPLVEGAAYFGCTVSKVSMKEMAFMTSIIGKAAKRSLGVSKTVSTSKALAFLGWQHPSKAIASRRLSLFRRAFTNPNDDLRTLYLNMIEDAPNVQDSEYLNILDQGVRGAFSDVEWESMEESWPKTIDEWKVVAADQTKVNELVSGTKKGMSLNYQHPLVRVTPNLAGIAFRFTLPSLRPYINPKNNEATPQEACQLCGEGANSPFHLITQCKHTSAVRARRNCLTDEEIRIWQSCRGSNTFTELNEYIDKVDPSLKEAADRIKDLIVIQSKGNDLDILARILRCKISTADDQDELLKTHSVERYEFTGGTKKRSGKQEPYYEKKEELYTGYYWVGTLCERLWGAYCTRLNKKGDDDDNPVGNNQ